VQLPSGRREALPETEQALIRDLVAGEDQALARAMDLYLRRVYALALGMLGNHADAEDLCQEVFLRLHQSARRLKPEGSLRPWLYRTCVNCCLDELRRRAHRPAPGLAETLELRPAAAPGPDEVAAERQFADQVAACLARLPPRQRAVFVLRHFGGMTTPEIARALGCAPGTVKCHLSRALASVRERLAAEGEAER